MVTDTEGTLATATSESEPANRTTGPAGSNFRIRGDTIQEVTANLPDRQRDALRWLAGYCQRTNQSHRAVAPLLKQPNGEPYSHDSIYHALTGGRTTDQLGNIVEAIERFRKLAEEREETVVTGFIPTLISRRIWANCRKALRRRRVLFIYGPSQIGKTVALEAYAKKFNHGETRYVRLPVGCGFKLFLRLLAEAAHVPMYQHEVALRDAIMGAFDDHMLLIVDEMHEPFGADGKNKLGVKVVNFLRELYDRRKCGLVLCGTSVFREALTLGPFAKNMEQILRRGLPPVQLPAAPTAADLALFAKAYGLGAAPDQEIGVKVTFVDSSGKEQQQTLTQNPSKLQAQVCADDGLGRWIAILQEAEDVAREKRRSLTWGIVLHAWHSFEHDDQFMPKEAA